MIAQQTKLRKAFARVSQVFALLGFLLFAPAAQANASETRHSAAQRQSASAQFARAEDLHAALNSKPAEKRSLAECKQVVASAGRVYLITQHAGGRPDRLLGVAERY